MKSTVAWRAARVPGWKSPRTPPAGPGNRPRPCPPRPRSRGQARCTRRIGFYSGIGWDWFGMVFLCWEVGVLGSEIGDIGVPQGLSLSNHGRLPAEPSTIAPPSEPEEACLPGRDQDSQPKVRQGSGCEKSRQSGVGGGPGKE